MIQRDTELPSPPRSQDGAESASLAPGESAEEQVERRCDAIIRELDEFCGMATNRETIDLVAAQNLAFGQMQTRVQLILSFLAARQPTTLRLIKNG